MPQKALIPNITLPVAKTELALLDVGDLSAAL